MKSVFQVLLLSAISMMMTVGANAHQSCKIEDRHVGKFLEPDGSLMTIQVHFQSAACLISQGVILANECIPSNPVGTDNRRCDFIKGPYQRRIDVMHPELGFVTCELSFGLKQSIFCYANGFERFNGENSRILENLTN